MEKLVLTETELEAAKLAEKIMEDKGFYPMAYSVGIIEPMNLVAHLIVMDRTHITYESSAEEFADEYVRTIRWELTRRWIEKADIEKLEYVIGLGAKIVPAAGFEIAADDIYGYKSQTKREAISENLYRI